MKEFYSLSQQDIAKYQSILGNNKTLTYDLFKSIWINLWIYYPSLDYTLITESPKTTVTELFTQIGGSLGLFVSFSVFTIFEFIEIFLLIMHSLIFR